MSTIYVIGVIGNILSIIQYIIPVELIINLCKSNEISKIPFFIFIMIIINCDFWLLIGLMKKDFFIWFNNIFGIVANLTYLIIFLYYLDIAIWITSFFASILILINSLLLILWYIYLWTYIKLTSIFGVIFNILLYAAPLQFTHKAINESDRSYIPIYTMILNLVNSIFWTIYGHLNNNIYIIIPNSLGIIISAFKLILYLVLTKDIKNKNEILTQEREEEKLNLSKKEI